MPAGKPKKTSSKTFNNDFPTSAQRNKSKSQKAVSKTVPTSSSQDMAGNNKKLKDYEKKAKLHNQAMTSSGTSGKTVKKTYQEVTKARDRYNKDTGNPTPAVVKAFDKTIAPFVLSGKRKKR